MAWVTVTCPACGGLLELERGLVGQIVECGACGRAFTARPEEIAARPSIDDEPPVVYTTPIDDPARRMDRQFVRLNTELQSAMTAMAWSMTSLLIGVCGVLLLPISFCCNLGVLGVVVAVIGLACGIVGLCGNSAGRTAAIAGITINACVGALCLAIYLNMVVLK
jgi:hypothetical protein